MIAKSEQNTMQSNSTKQKQSPRSSCFQANQQTRRLIRQTKRIAKMNRPVSKICTLKKILKKKKLLSQKNQHTNLNKQNNKDKKQKPVKQAINEITTLNIHQKILQIKLKIESCKINHSHQSHILISASNKQDEVKNLQKQKQLKQAVTLSTGQLLHQKVLKLKLQLQNQKNNYVHHGHVHILTTNTYSPAHNNIKYNKQYIENTEFYTKIKQILNKVKQSLQISIDTSNFMKNKLKQQKNDPGKESSSQ